MSNGRLAGIGSHHSARSETDEWLTPEWLIEALGPFDLDPCAPPVQPWPTAGRAFHAGDDGLAQSWENADGSPAFAWVNPPYSRIEPWMRRVAAHGHGLALIFARTETSVWFESIWGRATSVLFVRGRLTFHFPDGTPASANSGGPSALIAYGEEAHRRLLRGQVSGFDVATGRLLGPDRPVPGPRRVVAPAQGTYLFD